MRRGESSGLQGLLASFYRKNVLAPAARAAAKVGLEAERVYRADGVYAANVRALHLYRPRPYEGEAHLLLSREHMQTGTVLDRRLGWRDLIRPEPEVRLLEGSRRGLYSEAGHRVLAKAVGEACAG